MKPNDAKRSTYIDFGVENNNKYAKFDADDHVRIRVDFKLVRRIFCN